MLKGVMIVLAVIIALFVVILIAAPSLIESNSFLGEGGSSFLKGIINPPDQDSQPESPGGAIGGGTNNGGGGSSGGGGGGGGASGGEGSPGTPTPGCTFQKLAYSASNFQESSVCNSEESGDCVDKTIDCSVLIDNLDSEASGIFELEFKFFEEGNNINVLDTVLQEQNIQPLGNSTFDASSTIQGPDANLDITCFYTTTGIPSKEVC